MAAIGIDLGTTYSCVAAFQNGMIRIIHNELGNLTTPSYVAFTDTERLVGDAAKDQVAFNAANTIFDAKRLIGRRMDDPELPKDLTHWPFKVVDEGGWPKIEVEVKGERKRFLPEEISSMVLVKMKQIAEEYLGQPVKDAVITVPAYFNNAQRDATRKAGVIAGLNVLRIINEPTAGALAYGYYKRLQSTDGPKNVLIYDLGGGTLDVSIVKITGSNYHVQATSGNTHLGGEDFDSRLVEHLMEEFKRKNGADMSKNQRAVRRLRSQCEQAKRRLSTANQTTIAIDSLHQGLDLTAPITRARFEDLCEDLMQSAMEPVRNVLRDAKLSKADIDEIVLVGGSTRIIRIKELLQELFDGKKATTSVSADNAVAYGAAVQAAKLAGSKAQMFKNLALVDVTPLSLGLEVRSGLLSIAVPRNTEIPTKKTITIVTADDNQEKILFAIFEGERARAKDNHYLGKFTLSGLKRAPRGEAKTNVSFNIDANGILTVSAVDATNGNTAQITVQYDRLSVRDVARMLDEAETFKVEDNLQKERANAWMTLEEYCLKARNKFRTYSGQETSEKVFLDKVEDTLAWADQNRLAEKNETDNQYNRLVELAGALKLDIPK